MKYSLKFLRAVTVGLSILLLALSPSVFADGKNEGRGHGKNRNVGVGNASDGIKGDIRTGKGIIYTGQPLEISLRFSRGADLISDGAVDAYVVIFAPKHNSDDPESESDSDSGNSDTDSLTDAIVLPVSDVASENHHKLFVIEAVDISELPAGTYQLGLILTDPDGDPLVINDWYQGLLGLIDVTGLTITDEAVDFDKDGDGDVDDDNDGDGFSDDETDAGKDDADDDDSDDDDSDNSSDSTNSTDTTTND